MKLFCRLLLLLHVSLAQLPPPVFELTGSWHAEGIIQLQTLVHANEQTIPLLYMSKAESPILASEHPCVTAPNICCFTPFIAKYYTAPGVNSLANNTDLCTLDGVETLSDSGNNSLQMTSLKAHLFPLSIENTDYLSDAVGVTTSLDGTAASGYVLTTTFPLSYLQDNAASEVLAGGITRYEFVIGSVFVRLYDVMPAQVSIETIQQNIRFFTQDYTVVSVSTEQTRVYVDQVQTSLHQIRSTDTLQALQYAKLWFAYDREVYPGSPEVILDTVRIAKGAVSTSLYWQTACGAAGYYELGSASWRQGMDSIANETCVPHVPDFCSVGQFENFWLPLPAEYLTADGNLFFNFILKLRDTSGYAHLSNLYFSLDMNHWGVTEHCLTSSIEVGLDNLIQVTTSVGVLPQNESGTELVRRVTIGGTLDTVKGRRLLQTGCEEPICAAGYGRDALEVCDAAGKVQCTQCDGEDSVIKLRHNASLFGCVRDTCVVREGSGELKRWGRGGDGTEGAYKLWGLLESGTAVGVGRETEQIFLNDTALFHLVRAGESVIHLACSKEEFVVLTSWNRVFSCSETTCAEQELDNFSEITQVVSAAAGFWVVFQDGSTAGLGALHECVDAGSTASSAGVLNLAIASQLNLLGSTLEYDAIFVKSYEESE